MLFLVKIPVYKKSSLFILKCTYIFLHHTKNFEYKYRLLVGKLEVELSRRMSDFRKIFFQNSFDSLQNETKPETLDR